MHKNKKNILKEGLLSIFAFSFLYSSLPPEDIVKFLEWSSFIGIGEQKTTLMDSLNNWRAWSSVIALSLGIFLSIQYYLTSSKRIWATFVLGAVYAYCVFIVAFQIYMYFAAVKMERSGNGSEVYTESFHFEFNEFLVSDEKKLSERIQYSNKIASEYFKDTGKLLQVVNNNGEIQDYQPDDIDRHNRHEHMMLMFDLRDLAQGTKDKAIFNLILTISITVLTILFIHVNKILKITRYKHNNE